MLKNIIGQKVRITYFVGMNETKTIEGIYTGLDINGFYLIEDKIAIQSRYVISIEKI